MCVQRDGSFDQYLLTTSLQPTHPGGWIGVLLIKLVYKLEDVEKQGQEGNALILCWISLFTQSRHGNRSTLQAVHRLILSQVESAKSRMYTVFIPFLVHKGSINSL